MESIRPAAVAGTFYPGDPRTLAATVAALLGRAPEPDGPPPKALIVPHAGYVYSGPTAAVAYRRLAPARDRIRRVVLLGPAHRVPVGGLALPPWEAFATPLGAVPVDREAAAEVRDLPQVTVSGPAHAWEHSLEVQLPFLQTVLGDVRLVPLVVGDAAPREVAEVIERLWGGPETLVLVSSDLSHYHPYEVARRIDSETVRRILRFEPVSHAQACGGTPVNGLLPAARRHGLAPELLDLRNSGDTAGDQDEVVGYAAVAFVESDGILRLH